LSEIFNKLKNDVINQGLCTHCGTCSGLSNGKIKMKESKFGPIPELIINSGPLDDIIYNSCPGKGINYPSLVKSLFNSNVTDWRVGHYKDTYIGYSNKDQLREAGASGGVITTLLIYLLENNLIDGAIILKHGSPKPWLAEPIIATTVQQIKDGAQSVYAPIPVNTIFDKVKSFNGKLAYVGLPDQILSLRYLQNNNIKWSKKIKYVFGPYVGTNMYSDSIKSFLASNSYRDLDDINTLKYRDGEWPGYLKIVMKDGNVLKAEKFYYNYLIPFYITKSSLLSTDFTNELTDISVGDAWNPKYENLGKGFSVIISRTKNGDKLLKDMERKNLLNLDRIGLKETLDMHGHMLDFKKRGSFIRFKLRKIFGKKIPDFGYSPQKIDFKRIVVELFISSIFYFSSLSLTRYVLKFVPIKIIGPFFNFMRISWKNASRTIKRKDLDSYKVIIHEKRHE
jgi:coenzyme F420 hydrogenase subunit beta